jgi:RNA polymerase sigma-32 factor
MGIEGQFAGIAIQIRSELARASDGRGKGYLSDIRRFPMLERDQEYRLAKRWREQGDRDAADQLVTSHLRLAAKIAMGYRGYGLPVAEIISEGNVGLLQALNRFEPERGFRFATYAMWWIRASIQDYILRSWSLVKIGTTTNQRKLFFKLRSAKSKIAALESGDLHPDHVASIAKDLDVSDQDVVDMNRRLAGDRSINTPLHDGDDIGEWQDHLVDQSPSPEAIVVEQDEKDHQHDALVAAIEVLDDRERRIFEARHLADEPQTLEDLAEVFNVSRERIRQIEVRAFEKVRKAAKNFAAKAQPAMQEAWGA